MVKKDTSSFKVINNKTFSQKIREFLILNWRIIILSLLLILSISFLWWYSQEVDTNFTEPLNNLNTTR